MKLIIAIVNDDDALSLMNGLSDGGFGVTKMCSSGGFLRAGNTTLLCGVEEEELDAALDIIEQKSKSHKQFVNTAAMHTGGANNAFAAYPVEVTIGGATVFVIDVEQFRKF